MDSVLDEIDALLSSTETNAARKLRDTANASLVQVARDGEAVENSESVLSTTLLDGPGLYVTEKCETPALLDSFSDMRLWRAKLNLQHANQNGPTNIEKGFFSAKLTEHYESLRANAAHPWGRLCLGSLHVADEACLGVGNDESNTSSMQQVKRRPKSSKEQTRGRIGNRPFAPGGASCSEAERSLSENDRAQINSHAKSVIDAMQGLLVTSPGEQVEFDKAMLHSSAPGHLPGLDEKTVQNVLNNTNVSEEFRAVTGFSEREIGMAWQCQICAHNNTPSGGVTRLWCARCGDMPNDTVLPDASENIHEIPATELRSRHNEQRKMVARELARDTDEGLNTEPRPVESPEHKEEEDDDVEEAEEETLLLANHLNVEEGSRATTSTNSQIQKTTATEATSIDELLVEVESLEALVAERAAKADPLALQRHRKQQLEQNELSKQDMIEWAVTTPRDVSKFHVEIPQLAIEYPFELDNFQKQAVLHLEGGESVFVAAHTSAGKTVVAEYAVALAMEHRTRVVYTSPIKALSNQKYRDFQKRFSPEDVGLITGDVSVNPGASCLVMTTEILRSMLYRGADLIRDLEWVVFDEVHYVNDSERGVVWEEVIIMLPDHVGMVFLSATTPNTKEFSSWVGRTKQRKVHVISTEKRPIPLEHFLYAGGAMHKVLDSRKRFISEGHSAATRALRSAKENFIADNHKKGAKALGVGTAQQQRQRWNQQRGSGSGNKTEKEAWLTMIRDLAKRELLPVVVFSFSKKQCEERAAQLVNVDLSTAKEKSQAHIVIAMALKRLQGSDRELPQVLRIKALAEKGVAVHHGGLLPILKEVVEILFSRGLVKVLFATETFAMGVNMPARTVVYNGLRKHDGRAFRDLLPGEYTQMAGRAGRRGLDTVGTVLVACSPERGPPPIEVLHGMMTGQPTKLESQFRLTYNMILNLLRVAELTVADMMKRSFSEFGSQRLFGAGDLQVLISRGKAKAKHLLEQTLSDVTDDATRASTMELNSNLQQARGMSRHLLNDLVEGRFGLKAHASAFASGRVVLISHRDAGYPIELGAGWQLAPAIVLEDLYHPSYDQSISETPGAVRKLVVLSLVPGTVRSFDQVPDGYRFPTILEDNETPNSGINDDFAGMAIGKSKKNDDFAGMTIGKSKKNDDFAGMTIGKSKKNDDFAGMTIGKSKKNDDFGMFGGKKGKSKEQSPDVAARKTNSEILNSLMKLQSIAIGETDDNSLFSILQIDLEDIVVVTEVQTPKTIRTGDCIHSIVENKSTEMIAPLVKWMTELVSSNDASSLFGGIPSKFRSLDPVKELKVSDIQYVSEWHTQAAILERIGDLATQLSDRVDNLPLVVSSLQQVSRIESKVTKAQVMCSDENMALYPDFKARLGVLERLGFVSHEDNAVHLKGRVACEINTCDELILSELVFQNVFQDLDPAECVAALSALVLQTKCKEEPHLNVVLENARALMVRVAANLEVVQKRYGVEMDGDWLQKSLNFGLMEVVYHWARGMRFCDICQLTTMEEGSIVRCITRLDETCREVRNVAQVIGDPILLEKMQKASELIKRDIVFATSLYVG